MEVSVLRARPWDRSLPPRPVQQAPLLPLLSMPRVTALLPPGSIFKMCVHETAGISPAEA